MMAMGRMGERPISNAAAGFAFLLFLAVLVTAVLSKTQIANLFERGDIVTADFADSYKLRKHDSTVKVAGLTVGDVLSIDHQPGGIARVRMRVDHDAVVALGARPTAHIEPRTLLGGRYAIELRRGGGNGSFNGSIPLDRTTKPVELDRIAEALPADVRTSLRRLVGETGPALDKSSPALGSLLSDLPGVLEPAGDVMDAARGENPDSDLPTIVSDLHTAAQVVNRRPGELGSIAENLSDTTLVLAEHRQDVANVLEDLPAVLEDTRAGVKGLDRTVVELEALAPELRPTAERLDDLFGDLGPLLTDLGPLVRELRPVLRDAQPVVRTLVPISDRANGVLTDLHGPVLNRVNGPVAKFVNNPWKGSGPYEGGGAGYLADHKFYEEVGYLTSNMDRGSMQQDRLGTGLGFQAGVGTGLLSGVPFSLDNLYKMALDQAGVPEALQNSILKDLGLIP